MGIRASVRAELAAFGIVVGEEMGLALMADLLDVAEAHAARQARREAEQQAPPPSAPLRASVATVRHALASAGIATERLQV